MHLGAPSTIVQESLHNGNTFDLIVDAEPTAGTNRRPCLTYSSSRAALIRMSEVKEELAIYGIRVVRISPGRCVASPPRRTLARNEDPGTTMRPAHIAEVMEMPASAFGRYANSRDPVVRM